MENAFTIYDVHTSTVTYYESWTLSEDHQSIALMKLRAHFDSYLDHDSPELAKLPYKVS